MRPVKTNLLIFPARRSPWGKTKPQPTGAGIRSFLLVTVLSIIAGIIIGIAPEFIPPAPTNTPVILEGQARIIDGDTLSLDRQRVRLFGIDAPESSQFCFNKKGSRYSCGKMAKRYLSSLVNSGRLACKGSETDRYGRLIVICYSNQKDINAAMVASGWAVAYRHYSARYIPEEKIAKTAKAGLWQGRFQMPWAWRQNKRTSGRQVTENRSKACDIKGNISKNGKIYHLPGERWYDATKVEPARGERWFCSEREARAAGWRPSYN